MINYPRLLFSSNIINACFLYIILYPTLIYSQMTAVITSEYYTLSSNYISILQENQTNGVVSSTGSQIFISKGPAFTLVDSRGKYDGCQRPMNIMNYSKGIAIVQRGGNCTFSVKISRAKQYGAAAVIVYDPHSIAQDTYDIVHNNSDILCLYVQKSVGSILFSIANDKKSYLNLTIQPINYNYDDSTGDGVWNGSQGAIVFIIIAISILICSCFSWFIFYCFQRNRLRTTKDRLDNRLINAAKKALTKIPLVTINENYSTEESCVICLDTIKQGDIVRELTCRHRFHQNCVDPWLINHRHCPLCNLDILAAYRISVSGSTTDRSSIVSENQTPQFTTSLTTISGSAVIEEVNVHQQNDEQEQVQQVALIHTLPQPIPTISGSIKDQIHGEENPSFRSDEDHY